MNTKYFYLNKLWPLTNRAKAQGGLSTFLGSSSFLMIGIDEPRSLLKIFKELENGEVGVDWLKEKAREATGMGVAYLRNHRLNF